MTHVSSVQGPLGGWERLVTGRGELIRVEESATQIAVIVETPDGEAQARAAIPYPGRGCAGHELLLSAKERYLAMFLYSGQSEIGYELFYFRPRLQHISSFGYEFGEGLGPVFSSDERWLGLAWSTNPLFCLLEEGVEHVPTGECLVDWATLRIQRLPAGLATSCNVRVRVDPRFPPDGNEAYYPERLEILGEEARFHTAWGEQVRAPSPPPSSLIIPGPRYR
jgi:hypothetical protein